MKPKFFTFGAAHDGERMPEEMIQKILTNGCLEKSFERTLWRDWLPVCEIEESLKLFRHELSESISTVRQIVKLVRDQLKEEGAAAAPRAAEAVDCTHIARALTDAATAIKQALSASTMLADGSMAELDLDGEVLESIAMAGAKAACESLAPQPAAAARQISGEEALIALKLERAAVRSLVESVRRSVSILCPLDDCTVPPHTLCFEPRLKIATLLTELAFDEAARVGGRVLQRQQRARAHLDHVDAASSRPRHLEGPVAPPPS
eukprot:7388359-Prymnesium_polylepis.1